MARFLKGPGTFRFPGLFLCLIIWLSGCTSPQLISHPAASDLRNGFLLVALDQEFQEKKAGFLIRRDKSHPVQWHLFNHSNWRDYLQQDLLPEIAIATGLTFTPAPATPRPAPQEADLFLDIAARSFRCGPVCDDLVRILPPRTVSRLQGKDCFFISRTNARHQIVSSYIFIRRGLGQRQTRHCLDEEIAQSLGLPGDHQMLKDSIFRDGSDLAGLSRSDFLFLEWLYSDALSPGMNAAEIRTQLENMPE